MASGSAVQMNRDRLQAGAVGGRDFDGHPFAHGPDMVCRLRDEYLIPYFPFDLGRG